MSTTPNLGYPYENIEPHVDRFQAEPLADSGNCMSPSELLSHKDMLRFFVLCNVHVIAKQEAERKPTDRLPDPLIPDFEDLSNTNCFYYVNKMHQLYTQLKEAGRINVTDEVHGRVEATYALLSENCERAAKFECSLQEPFKN